MSGLPASNLAEVKPSGGFSAVRPQGVPVYIGCSSAGTTSPKTFGRTSQARIAAEYEAGPLSRKAGYCASQTNSDCVCIRVPATSRAASKTTASVSRSGSSDFTYTLTGTPTDGADVVIRFVVGGTTGSAGITYKVSLDGGETFDATATALGTSTSIVVLGVTLALGSTKAVTAADEVSWSQRAASASTSPLATTRIGSSTFSIAASGTPADGYRGRLEFLDGGELGTAGITYRYCLDWDGTQGKWQGPYQLGTGTTIAPLDGTIASGLTLTLSTSGSSTVDAGDVVEWRCYAPEAQWSDIDAALDALLAANVSWSFLVVLSPLSGTDAASFATKLSGWLPTRRAWGICETRDREHYETIDAHASIVKADFTSFTSSLVFPAAGHAPFADPITKRRDRGSAALDYAIRAVSQSISTDPGQESLGALPASRALYDSTGVTQTEYDARQDPVLFDAHGDGFGFLVLRTYKDQAGTFPAGGIGMPSDGDIGLIAHRRVLNVLHDALQTQGRKELLSKFRRWTAAQVANTGGAYKAGDIREEDARDIESRLRIAGEAAVKGHASDVRVILSRTPVALGGGRLGLSYQAKCAPLGYVYQISGEVGLVDPAFEA